MMIDINDRVRSIALRSKIVDANEAAAIIRPGMNIGTSGFTPAGAVKAIPVAIGEKAKQEHAEGRPFKISLLYE